MTNKNPFEIRFDLLTLARDSLQTEYFSKIEEAKNFPSKLTNGLPKYPSKDDIFALAEEYKNFIERK